MGVCSRGGGGGGQNHRSILPASYPHVASTGMYMYCHHSPCRVRTTVAGSLAYMRQHTLTPSCRVWHTGGPALGSHASVTRVRKRGELGGEGGGILSHIMQGEEEKGEREDRGGSGTIQW